MGEWDRVRGKERCRLVPKDDYDDDVISLHNSPAKLISHKRITHTHLHTHTAHLADGVRMDERWFEGCGAE